VTVLSENLDDSQREVTAFLSTPGNIEASVDDMKVIETHISRIFLYKDRALKMKRAVRFPYLDFSTLEKRCAACEAEIKTNIRTAPSIYRGVVPVSRNADGELELAGDGIPVEWLVDMNRFDEDGLFDRMVSSGQLRRHAMVDLADHVARFHDQSDRRMDAGGSVGTRLIIDSINASFEESVPVLDGQKIETWTRLSAGVFDEVAETLDARRDAGAVRHCHGDMHLRNICMIDGKPVLFDGIEFNADFSEIDTLYDLAFLIMDLDYRDQRRLANIVLNRYFDVTGEVANRPGTLAVLPLFLSMRAAVRAHVDAAQSLLLSDPITRNKRRGEAGRYLDFAIDYLQPPPPRLVAVGGLSGSGKSRMAREMAHFIGAAPGARVVRTDAVRKRIAGVQQEARLGANGYTHDMHARTYSAFYEEAKKALAQGASVVADAVFPGVDQRFVVEALASAENVPFQGLWIEAPEDVRVERVKARQRNISDITEEIAREQSSYDLGEVTWTRIDSSGPKDVTVALGRQAINE